MTSAELDDPIGHATADDDGADAPRAKKQIFRGSHRLLLFVAAVILAIGGLVYFSSTETLSPSRIAGAPSLDSTPGGRRQAESPRYQETLEQANDQNSAQARLERETFVSTPEAVSVPLDPPEPGAPTPWSVKRPDDNAVPPPLVQADPTIRGPRQRQQTSAEEPRTAPPPKQEPGKPQENPWTNLIMQQAASVIGAWTPTSSASQILMQPEDGSGASTVEGGAAASASSAAGAGGSEPNPTELVVPAGTILYGEAVTTTTSDGPGAPVVVEITTGDFKGARLIGRFQVAERSNRMVVQFGSLTLPTGETLQANAYAVDGRSAETAIASDVDHRFLQRYGPLLAASFISGFGATAAEVGSSVVAIGNSAVITSDAPDLEQALFAGIGEVGAVVAEDIREATPNGPLVKLEAGWPVAVLFVQPVERDLDR